MELCFESLDSFEKAYFVLGSELWMTLAIMFNLHIDVWELRKARPYDEI